MMPPCSCQNCALCFDRIVTRDVMRKLVPILESPALVELREALVMRPPTDGELAVRLEVIDAELARRGVDRRPS